MVTSERRIMASAGKTRGERTEEEKAVAAAGVLDEVEEITEPAREAPGHGVYDQAPSRVVIAGVSPEVDGGQFPIKRTVGEEVAVAANILGDGHDVIVAVVRHRSTEATEWDEVPMILQANDRWSGRFAVTALGWHEYTIQAWVDRFLTWHREVMKKHEAGQPDLTSELLEGAALLCEAAERANGPDVGWLRERAELLAGTESEVSRVRAGLSRDLVERMARYPDRSAASTYDRPLRIMVERERARFGAWYEMFPRSASSVVGRHGTFSDVEARLGYIAEMGFDVLYLPPIHPIGRAFRKGPNNTLTPGPNDPGSPWAIGGPEGGHKAIHPDLGTIEDFDRFVREARDFGIELALDIAFQCSPDHPYVREHPQWFRHRPDGTIKYAENPPKKYQDIYPIDFECDDWKALWAELRDVFLYWIDHGVTIFQRCLEFAAAHRVLSGLDLIDFHRQDRVLASQHLRAEELLHLLAFHGGLLAQLIDGIGLCFGFGRGRPGRLRRLGRFGRPFAEPEVVQLDGRRGQDDIHARRHQRCVEFAVPGQLTLPDLQEQRRHLVATVGHTELARG